MKTNIRSIASILTAGFLAFCASPAHALTNEDLVGQYQGNSTAYNANGGTLTAQVGFTFKLKGRVKSVAIVNGQTVLSKGIYQFVSDNAILETTDGGEALIFVDKAGTTLTFNVLVRLDNGQIVREVTVVHQVR